MPVLLPFFNTFYLPTMFSTNLGMQEALNNKPV